VPLHSLFLTLGCAEAFLCLVRSRDLIVLCKSDPQRTEDERTRVRHGLLRSFLVEVLLLVPLSVFLVFVAIRPILLKTGAAALGDAFDGLVGVISYGFPFATLKEVVTRVALRTLKDFVDIASQSVAEKSLEGKSDATRV
jgi:hypothetical protein